jgi:hypothetical protein
MPTNLDGDGGPFKPPHALPRYPGNIVQLRPGASSRRSAFDRLTARLVMQRFREGTLDPAVLVALMAAVGLQP